MSMYLVDLSSSQEKKEPAPEDRSKTFTPVEPGGETQSGQMLMTVAYSLIWLMAMALILLSMRRQRQLDARITQLSQDIERARKAEPKRAAGKGD
jgi:hypothetical protein